MPRQTEANVTTTLEDKDRGDFFLSWATDVPKERPNGVTSEGGTLEDSDDDDGVMMEEG